MRSCPSAVGMILVLAVVLPVSLCAGIVTLDFEGFPDGTLLTNQYSGLTFTNATVLMAGISLNEFEFPPRSGVNVVSDNGAPILISFSTPVPSLPPFLPTPRR